MKRVTLSDVAAHAGVSRATASLALRGEGRLAESTRELVRESMRELGYVYHRGAASLRTHTSSVIGLLVTDLSNPFFGAISVAFEQELAGQNHLTMMANTFDDSNRQADIIRTMLEHPVDAIVFVPSLMSQPPPASSRTPVLAITRRPPSDLPYLGNDDRLGGYLAARHVSDVHGRRRLVYLGGPELASARGDRISGAQLASDETAGMKLVATFAGETTVESGIDLARRLLDSDVEFDAVLCHSDLVASAFLRVSRDRGIRVPEDVAIVGFDGLAEGALTEPPLTTVTSVPSETGRRAARRVLGLMAGTDDGGQVLLTPHLEIRSSCGCERIAPL